MQTNKQYKIRILIFNIISLKVIHILHFIIFQFNIFNFPLIFTERTKIYSTIFNLLKFRLEINSSWSVFKRYMICHSAGRHYSKVFHYAPSGTDSLKLLKDKEKFHSFILHSFLLSSRNSFVRTFYFYFYTKTV